MFPPGCAPLGPKVAEEVMTLAERLRREGERKGRREGEITGIRKLLLRQLRQRFGVLPSDALSRIENADRPTLDAWGRRVLKAASLDEVLAAKPRRRA